MPTPLGVIIAKIKIDIQNKMSYIGIIKKTKEMKMNVNEAMSLAVQLETLADMAKLFNSSRDQLCESILMVSKNLKDMADDMDVAMYNELRTDADAYNARRGV